MVVFILAVGCALLFSFLCSIFESVLLSVSRGYVEGMARSGSRAGKILKRWQRNAIEVPVAAILILNTIAHTVGATMAGSSYEKVFDPSTTVIFSAVFTLAILLFTEIIPKTLGVTFANRLAAPVTLAVRALVFLLYPLLKVTSAISGMLTKGHRTPVTSIEEIRLLAAIGHHEGDVGPRFAQFIEGVASLRELTVNEVMVPRVSIAYLSAERSFDENIEVVRRSGHSRFPFTSSGDLDDVDGVVLAKELFFFEHDSPDGAEPEWSKLKQPLVIVPKTKTLDEVLRLVQEQRKHLAVVVDEYGGTQGVLTLEDVLEEIVGEIEDETDRIEPLQWQLHGPCARRDPQAVQGGRCARQGGLHQRGWLGCGAAGARAQGWRQRGLESAAVRGHQGIVAPCRADLGHGVGRAAQEQRARVRLTVGCGAVAPLR